MRSSRSAVAAAVLLLLAACRPSKPPPPPVRLTVALVTADKAAAENGDLAGACEAVSRELIDFKNARGVPIRTQADLQQLAMEVATLGAQVDPMNPGRAPPWVPLRAKIDRVLQGENPTPGPRYQLDMPAEVESAIHLVDDALEARDRDAACQAISRARGAIVVWEAKMMPGPRLNRIHNVTEMDLMFFIKPCKQLELSELSAVWRKAVTALAPAGD